MIVFNNRMIAIVGLLAHILPDNDSGNPAAAFGVDVSNCPIGGLGSPPGYVADVAGIRLPSRSSVKYVAGIAWAVSTSRKDP